MKTTTLIVATALALGALAGCDRKPEPRTTVTTPPSQAGSGASTPGSTQNTPANAGTPSPAEKREGSNPVQGQVDPKQNEQNKDFKQGGDAAGPKQ
jgi:hypothetical protein